MDTSSHELSIALDDAITKYNEMREHLNDAITSPGFTTVMGAGIVTGNESLDDIENVLKACSYLTGKEKGKAFKDLTKGVQSIIDQAILEALQLATTNASQHITDVTAADFQDIGYSLGESVKVAKTLSEQADNIAKGIAPDRQKAITRFQESIKMLEEANLSLMNHDEAIDSLDKQLEALYISKECVTDAAAGSEVTRLQKLRKGIEDERAHKTKKILRHFDEQISASLTQSGFKKDTNDLIIPAKLEQGRGQDLIDNLFAYLRNRASEYYAILPYLYRIGSDYDPTIGSFYKPPCFDNHYEGVSATLLPHYLTQSQGLYNEFKLKTPRQLMLRITSTFKYGLHDQLSARCGVGDGVTAYFSLLSLFRPSAAAYRDELTETFNQAFTRFHKGDPKLAINQLRSKLTEVITLQVQINWSSTGKKIVGVLSLRSHYLAQAIKKYESGPEKDTSVGIYLQDLFSAIESECDNITRLGATLKSDVQWNANSARATDPRARPTQPCRFGDKCFRLDCRYWHQKKAKTIPEEHIPTILKGQKRSHNGQQLKGSAAKKGMKIECEAMGCTEVTKKAFKATDGPNIKGGYFRFCATCFLKGLKVGFITLKNGDSHTLNKTKPEPKLAFGFSAEQIEGLKLLSTANSASLEFDKPAPASVKRLRVQERLGAAYQAAVTQSQPEAVTQSFLDAIYSTE